MGLFDQLSKIFRRKTTDLMIESSNQSINHQSITPRDENLDKISLEKDSLHLGLAAGYTGRAIKEIEGSLNRIETNMLTKDWFTINFKDSFEKRLAEISSSLDKIVKIAEKAPEPIKSDLFKQIGQIEDQLSLTQKMRALVAIAKEHKEISYSELAGRLGISENALRGLLSTTVRRTNFIERFEKDGRGWVKFVDSIANQSIRPQEETKSEFLDERALRNSFRRALLDRGYEIVKEFESGSPDLLIKKSGVLIAAELKRKIDFSKAFGQLVYAKSRYNVQEMWLVLGEVPAKSSYVWLEIMMKEGIKVYIMEANNLVILQDSMLKEPLKREFEEIDNEIESLLRQFPSGLTKSEISMKLETDMETVQNHVKAAVEGDIASSLKEKIRLDGNRIILKINE